MPESHIPTPDVRPLCQIISKEVRHIISQAADDILNEVERVLGRPKFGWSQDRTDAAVREISGFTEHVEPTQRIDVVTEDPTDNRIVECAAASGSEYLVIGDKHLLKLGQYRGIKIVPPADFLEIQAQKARGR